MIYCDRQYQYGPGVGSAEAVKPLGRFLPGTGDFGVGVPRSPRSLAQASRVFRHERGRRTPFWFFLAIGEINRASSRISGLDAAQNRKSPCAVGLSREIPLPG